MTDSFHPETAPPARRGPWRAFLETRGLVGGHDGPHATVRLRATDGTALVGSWLPGPTHDAPAVVLAHGFAGHGRKPAYARLAATLTARAHVLALDLRGHGRSGGLTTLGDREALDVAAAVAWLRGHGHATVIGIGASMGATSLVHAAATGVPLDAIVTVSAPGVLEEDPATAAMQRLRRLWESPVSRAGMRWGIGVRVVSPQRWRHPGDPRDLARQVTVPMLVVHGADDAYFPVAHAEALAAAGPHGTLWIEPHGFGHAEDGFSQEFLDRLTEAVGSVATTGRFPARTPEQP